MKITNIWNIKFTKTVVSSDIENNDFIIIGNEEDIKNRQGYSLFPGEQITLNTHPKNIWVRIKDIKGKNSLLNWVST